MANATCEVSVSGGAYGSASSGVDCAASAAVIIRPVSTAGIKTWTCQCIGTDEGQSKTTINAAITIDGVNKTASLSMPAANGVALRMRSTATDYDGTVTTSDLVLYTRTSQGKRVVAFEESLESSTFGTIAQLNAAIRDVGQVSIDMLNAARVLTALENAYAVIKVASTPNFTAARTLTFPAPLSLAESYLRVVRNTQGGAFAVTCSTGAGTTVAVAQGKAATLLFDTTGVVRITADT